MNEHMRYLILGIIFSLIGAIALMEGIDMNEMIMIGGGIVCLVYGMYCFFTGGKFSE
jgi:hypothetical protein